MVVDLANATHRARGGFKMGPAPILFNFFRSFRTLVEMIDPTRIVLVDEGTPRARLRSLPEYKANREIPKEDIIRQEEMRRYRWQRDICIDLLKKYFPVSVVRHPDYEADDTIYDVVKKATRAVETVVVSSDSDFIQLLNEFENVKLYNPVKKKWLEKPQYDYVVWKSLRGDPTDNIPPALDGSQQKMDEFAEKLSMDAQAMASFFHSNKTAAERFIANTDLISLKTLDMSTIDLFESSSPNRDWDTVFAVFDSYGFKSITNEQSWKKFTDTFDKLW
jgi:hypothetical protein